MPVLYYLLFFLQSAWTEVDFLGSHPSNVEINYLEPSVFSHDSISDCYIVMCDSVVVELNYPFDDIHYTPDFIFEFEFMKKVVPCFKVDKINLSPFHEELKLYSFFDFIGSVVLNDWFRASSYQIVDDVQMFAVEKLFFFLLPASEPLNVFPWVNLIRNG